MAGPRVQGSGTARQSRQHADTSAHLDQGGEVVPPRHPASRRKPGRSPRRCWRTPRCTNSNLGATARQPSAFLIDGLARSRANVYRQREGVARRDRCFRTLVRAAVRRESERTDGIEEDDKKTTEAKDCAKNY